MDKYEFNIKVEQMKKMVKKGDYSTAMKIADGIDWRRVRNAGLLSTVAQIYENNNMYQEAKDILLLAFERAPIGKRLLFKLTELALKEGNIEEAESYYHEYCDLAQDDSGQHLLRYEILREKGAPTEQLIHSLERYTKEELDEKWMYELAELYSNVGMADECIALCDRIMLLFGLGKYVDKAMDLKIQYAPLTKYQMDLVENRDKYEEQLRVVEQEYSSPSNRLRRRYEEKGDLDVNTDDSREYNRTTREEESYNRPEIRQRFRGRQEVDINQYAVSDTEPDEYSEDRYDGKPVVRVVERTEQPEVYEKPSEQRWEDDELQVQLHEQDVEKELAEQMSKITSEESQEDMGATRIMPAIRRSASYSDDEEDDYSAPAYSTPVRTASASSVSRYETPDYETPDYESPNYEASAYKTTVPETSTYETSAYETTTYRKPVYGASASTAEEMMADARIDTAVSSASENLVRETSKSQKNQKAQKNPRNEENPSPNIETTIKTSIKTSIKTNIETNVEDTIEEIEDMEPDFESKIYNHIMVESENEEEGLRLAMKALKKLQEEMGQKRQTAKISSDKLNQKGFQVYLSKLEGKNLIILEAARMNLNAQNELIQLLQNNKSEMLIVLIDSPLHLEILHSHNPQLAKYFSYIGTEKSAQTTQDMQELQEETESQYEEMSYTAKSAKSSALEAQDMLSEEQPKKVVSDDSIEKTEDRTVRENKVKAESSEEAPKKQKTKKQNMQSMVQEPMNETKASRPEQLRVKTQEENIAEQGVLSMNDFAKYACEYAKSIDCSIVGKSLLALYERVELMDADGVPLTREKAEDLIEEAADKAEKKSLGSLISRLFSPKYDKDGKLILKESHFI